MRTRAALLATVIGTAAVTAAYVTGARHPLPRPPVPAPPSTALSAVPTVDHSPVLLHGSREFRPDVLLGPVILVMTGVIVDRLRESSVGESVTAWLLLSGVLIGGLLSRWAGYRWIARSFYGFLVVFSWTVAKLYVSTPFTVLPSAWVASTFAASLGWLLSDIIAAVRRRGGPGHALPVFAVVGNWLGFMLAWAVIAQLMFQAARSVAAAESVGAREWVSATMIVVAGLVGVAVATLPLPVHRIRWLLAAAAAMTLGILVNY